MELLPYFNARITRLDSSADRRRYRLPRSPQYYSEQLRFIDTPKAAGEMVDLARQLPLSYVAIDAEYRFDRPGVQLAHDTIAHDPRSIRPLLLSVVLAATDGTPQSRKGGILYPVLVDFRDSRLLSALNDLFRLPVCFVGHNLYAELICLLHHGLPEPALLWDTQVCEQAFHLGRFHKKYARVDSGNAGVDDANDAQRQAIKQEDDEFRNGLVATCRRYGVDHPYAADKDRIRLSFLDHALSAPFSQEQKEYAAADAVAAATLYPLQVQAALQGGILQHLNTVEMPWVATNTRMVWHGVRVDSEKCQCVRAACREQLAALESQLAEYGITNPRSFGQLKTFFTQTGLLDLFGRKNRLSFDKDALEMFADRHPVINLIRAARKVLQLQADKLLIGEFVGTDGRVHPGHRQLGADTGRQSCKAPNILGLGCIFRPLIIPAEGYGIGEVDLSQIEVGLAGAVYHDPLLVEMFNAGDIYCNMARHFYRGVLSADDLALPDAVFKKRFGRLRNHMKRCTLGILYGLAAHGLALYLNIGKAEAAELLERFLTMFPALKKALFDVWTFGGRRGYVSTVSGLRRYRANVNCAVTQWERNWMTNHPVQGSAAVVFKAAGNRLDKLYRQHDAGLIVQGLRITDCPASW